MNEAVTVKVPSPKPDIEKDPSTFDEAPLSVPSTVTFAPARTLPSWSLTVPVTFCANKVDTDKSRTNAN